MCVCALCVCALCVCVRVVVSQARLRSVSIYSTVKKQIVFCFEYYERNFVYLGISFKLILEFFQVYFLKMEKNWS